MNEPQNCVPNPDTAPAEFYDEMWQRWGHLDAQSPAAFHRRRLILARLRQRVPPRGRVLEVGCGQGLLLEALRARTPELELGGSDVSAHSLDTTRARVGAGVELFAMNLSGCDFESVHAGRMGTYDGIVCSEVLEHLPDDELGLRRLRSLLAPRGYLVLTVPGGRMSRFDVLIGHQRHYTRCSLRSLIERAGLEAIEVSAWGFPFHNAYRSAVRLASRVLLRDAVPANPSGNRGSGPVAHLYSAAGRVLLPLYYANLSRWGEQMVAVARTG